MRRYIINGYSSLHAVNCEMELAIEPAIPFTKKYFVYQYSPMISSIGNGTDESVLIIELFLFIYSAFYYRIF
jgi:hypothetical protein